jgi:hypothetical protein
MVVDRFGPGERHYLPNRAAYEFSVGYRPRQGQLLKSGYTFMPSHHRHGPSDDVLGVQWVVDLPGFSLTR